jgi:Fic family protein
MHLTTIKNIEKLKEQLDNLRPGKDSLLTLLEEAELPESVYNSNAIENSTLTLVETEKILLQQEIPGRHSKREIFETINLARVTEYLNEKLTKNIALTQDILLQAHAALLHQINDSFAGRFRTGDEYVRVGRHIAPSPVHIPSLMEKAIEEYYKPQPHALQRIISFHLEFERVHPFVDGNGRVGRALLNFQLKSHGYPPVIVRNKEKKEYYTGFAEYDDKRATKKLEHVLALLLKESMHKRITYLRGDDIQLLSDMARMTSKHSPQSLTNAAKKQSLPAFREQGRWKVGVKMFEEWMEREE